MKTYQFDAKWYNEEAKEYFTTYNPYPRTFSQAVNQVFQYLNCENITEIDPYPYNYFEPILEEDDKDENA